MRELKDHLGYEPSENTVGIFVGSGAGSHGTKLAEAVAKLEEAGKEVVLIKEGEIDESTAQESLKEALGVRAHHILPFVPPPSIDDIKDSYEVYAQDPYFNKPLKRGYYAEIRKEPKIGRNDPCPCGSGLKYKKCTCK